MTLEVSIAAFAPAPPLDVADGLLGWLDLEFGGALAISGVALRRTRTGGLALSFPTREDRRKTRRDVVRPIDDRARRAIEAQVFDSLREMGVVAA